RRRRGLQPAEQPRSGDVPGPRRGGGGLGIPPTETAGGPFLGGGGARPEVSTDARRGPSHGAGRARTPGRAAAARTPDRRGAARAGGTHVSRTLLLRFRRVDGRSRLAPVAPRPPS